MQLFSFSSFDHLTSDQCFLSFLQGNTQVLYISVFVFQEPFQRIISHLLTRYGSKVISITTTRVRFFTSLTLFSVNKTNFKIVLNNVQSPSSPLIQSNTLPCAFNLPLLAKISFTTFDNPGFIPKKCLTLIFHYF